MMHRILLSVLLFLPFSCTENEKIYHTGDDKKCESIDITSEMEKTLEEELVVYYDDIMEDSLQISYFDFINYLRRIWGISEIRQVKGKPNFENIEGKTVIWITTSQEGKLAGNTNIGNGFLLKKINIRNNKAFLIYAPDSINLSYALYAFLEKLGIRFFHPVDEFVPEFQDIYLPQKLNYEVSSPFITRGIHLHLLHPIEYFNSFNVAGEENFSEAKKFIDWLVKTGQNYIQWSVLKTLDFSNWIEHAKRIVDYAHLRGIKVGAEIQLLGISSLQNSYVLAESMDNWQDQINKKIDFLMQIPWDNIEIAFGEFLAGDPQAVIDMLNYIADYMANKYPKTSVSVVNHVGNYPHLWINYNNKTVFYYHLPKFTDLRIINNVHTVFFFDLFRNWGGYNHPNFHLQKDYIMELLPSRLVRYKPESAYWASADIDVPAFLPEYIYSRWIDIYGLVKEISEEGLPMLEGHILFSSGHEWAYWLTDYLTAKMLWEPRKNFDYFIEYYSTVYGNCSGDMKVSLLEFIDLQTKYLFDNKLIPYISGEDLYDDIGYLVRIETHPKRVQFEELLTSSKEEIRTFESNVLKKLGEMADKIGPIESKVRKLCDVSDQLLKPWCMEILDGVKIIRLRALHSLNLYEAIISSIVMQNYTKFFREAVKIKEEARNVIENREKSYRFAAQRYIGSFMNPTIYPFGYLKQAHTLCFWVRQEAQAKLVTQNRSKPNFLELPTCIE